MDELTGHLREKDVLDITSVQFAILETNGNLSVFPYPRYRPATAAEAGIPVSDQHLPITILEDGTIPQVEGTSAGAGYRVDHLEMTVHFEDNEQHIPHRLEREKRNGRVEMVDQNTCKYIVDTYDASEMVPWLRTFIGRIEKLECSDQKVVDKFYEDMEQMYSLYGGEE
jgi:hypothetical protein